MLKNDNIRPRALTAKELEERGQDIYDSFANYLCFCPDCSYVDKTNMYIMRAEARVKKLLEKGERCPVCGKSAWTLGYPADSPTGFVKF